MVRGPVRLTRRRRVLNEEREAVGWAEGEDYETSTCRGLCRCGHSNDKPYCDGSHAEIEFEGELTADRAPGKGRREVFEGEGMTLTDDRSLCAGYGFCRPYGGVWKQVAETGDPEVRERVKRQILLCPTGRLEYLETPGGEPVEAETEPVIAVIPNGPLWILGGIPIVAPDGFVYEPHNRMCLCRCGESGNKPFCDGTHKKAGFKAS